MEILHLPLIVSSFFFTKHAYPHVLFWPLKIFIYPISVGHILHAGRHSSGLVDHILLGLFAVYEVNACFPPLRLDANYIRYVVWPISYYISLPPIVKHIENITFLCIHIVFMFSFVNKYLFLIYMFFIYFSSLYDCGLCGVSLWLEFGWLP